MYHGSPRNGQLGTGFCVKSKWKHNNKSYQLINEPTATLVININKQNINIKYNQCSCTNEQRTRRTKNTILRHTTRNSIRNGNKKITYNSYNGRF